MNTYIIGYDLNAPDQDYEIVIATIKTFGKWWHCLDSTWIVISELNEVQIRNTILDLIDQNDSLFVGELSGNAAWYLKPKCSKWLSTNL